MNIKYLCFILIVFSFISCDNSQKLFYNFKDTQWDFNNPVVFFIDIKDASRTYDMSLFFYNNLNYPYQNLYIIAETSYQNNILSTDTLHYDITDKYGKWLGEGVGNTKNNYFNYKKKLVFDKTGTYNIVLKHGMRKNPLDGSVTIGLKMIKND
tara:strand:+ start:149 stop:607 length:459 start_codon:yes stop_codon:yes gene_type:complete